MKSVLLFLTATFAFCATSAQAGVIVSRDATPDLDRMKVIIEMAGGDENEDGYVAQQRPSSSSLCGGCTGSFSNAGSAISTARVTIDRPLNARPIYIRELTLRIPPARSSLLRPV
ncbi:MAG: hypothetical protein AAFX06_08895 [Planctomycetota bacterium]